MLSDGIVYASTADHLSKVAAVMAKAKELRHSRTLLFEGGGGLGAGVCLIEKKAMGLERRGERW
ncbi:MAG: hypothetical protein NVS3B25_28220 [Hymenobacter sp.]